MITGDMSFYNFYIVSLTYLSYYIKCALSNNYALIRLTVFRDQHDMILYIIHTVA